MIVRLAAFLPCYPMVSAKRGSIASKNKENPLDDLKPIPSRREMAGG
jgi:hypothetical protein